MKHQNLKYTINNLFLGLCIFLTATFSLEAATPGLPFIEDFSGNTLIDQAKTNLQWSKTEQKVYLAWRAQMINVMSDPVVLDVGGATDETRAIVLGDINGDGRPDLVTGNKDRTNKLYLNTGTAVPFTQDTVINITTDVDDTRSIFLGDVDGDGDIDLVAGNYDQVNKLYLNDGDENPFDTSAGIPIGTDEDYTTAIALGDMDGDGDLDVVAGNSGQTNKLYLNDGDADPFDMAVTTDIGSETNDTRAIALGDVNGDGILDVVTGNDYQTNKLYLNDGEGDPFDMVTVYEIGSSYTNQTRAIALGDLDRDGYLDVVEGNDGSNRMYFNDGEGDPFDTEPGGENIGTDNDETNAIVLGDMNGEGLLDIVTGQWGQASRLIIPNSNTTFGTFYGNLTSIDIGTDTDDTLAIAVGDVNGDGKLDLVTGSYYGQMNRLYINNGKQESPEIVNAIGIPIGSDPDRTEAVAVGDMDGDGDLDVVVGNYIGINKLYLNDGDGDPFDTVTGISIGTEENYTHAIAVGDIDRDGDLDVVVGNHSQTNRLYLNDGDADPFDTATTGIPIGTDEDHTYGIALGDMDGDGDLDVVAGNNTETNKLYFNDGVGNPFDTIPTAPIGTETDATQAISVGDIDDDGNLDVVAGNANQVNRLYLNDGDADPFTPAAPGTTVGGYARYTQSIALGDIDGDGDLDVIEGEGKIRFYQNDGDGDPFDSDTSGTQIDITTIYSLGSTSIALGDIDGDGDLDVVSGFDGGINQPFGTRLFLNEGSGVFDSGNGIQLGSDTDITNAVALADMNGDGKLDILSGNNYQINRVYLNNPWKNWVGPEFSLAGVLLNNEDYRNHTFAIALADVNSDGKLDVIAGNGNNTKENKLYLNDGSVIPFETTTAIEIGLGSYPYRNAYWTDAIAVGDMDGDGYPDVVAGNINSETNNLYLNDGDGDPFDTIPGTQIGSDTDNTKAIAVGDMDGDGDLDVVAGNSYQVNRLYLNDGVGDPFDSLTTGLPIGTDADETNAIAVGDIDGDGDLDVVVGNGDNEISRLYLNDGEGDPFDSLTTGLPIGTSGYPTFGIALGDIDGDGDLDVVTGNGSSTWDSHSRNFVYLNDGDSDPFDSPGIPIGGDDDEDYSRSIALVDIDGDGDLDVFDGFRLYLNTHSENPFSGEGIIVTSSAVTTYAVALGDMDGDGDLDIVRGNYNYDSDSENEIYFQGGAYNTANGLVTSLEIDTETEDNIANAILAADEVLPVNTQINYFLSNTGGTKFYQVQPGVEFEFPTVGSDLRWRAELTSLSPLITPKITEIRITNRNIQPVVTGGQAVFYWEDDPPLAIDEYILVTDIDHANLVSATIRISNGYQQSEDVLGFTNANGINGSWNPLTGELTLTGNASVEQYQAALQGVTYVNIDQGNPTPGTRTILFAVNDGFMDSLAVSSTIHMESINDPPAITSHDPDPVSIIQGGSIELFLSSDPAPAGEIHLTVVDPDNNPDDLLLIIQSGDNYFLLGDTITPLDYFFGVITVPLIVYDGDDYSEEYMLTIHVEDVTDPMVSSVIVLAGGMTVDITFSESMGNGVTTAGSYVVSGSGRGSLSLNPDTVQYLFLNTYRLTWNTGEMAAGGDITITASGVEDASGRAIGIPDSGTDMGGGIGISPVTTADPAGGHYYNVQQVTLDCVDADSGCAETYYTTDGTEPALSSTPYTGPMPIGTYTELRFFSVDQAGNREATQTEVYHIDIPTTISCILAGGNILLGESLRVSGLISPLPAGPAQGLGIRLYPPGVTDPAAAIQIPVETHTGGSFEKWIDCELLDVAGAWKVETTWAGDASHLGAQSFQETLTVSMADSSLVLDIVMGETIKINNQPPIGGKLTAVPFCGGGDLSGHSIILNITEPIPSGTVRTVPVSTNLNGQFIIDYEAAGFAFDLLGEWTIQASFVDNIDYASAMSDPVKVRVVPTAGYAVIIQGKSETGEGLASHLKTTNFVYDTLLQRRLLPEDIEYFSWDILNPRWDDFPFKEGIETAIKQTIKDKMIANAGDLYIVMVDHGWSSLTDPSKGEFYIHPDDPITSTELGQWLDELQASLVGTAAEHRKIILILGFCRAGTFIDESSGRNRIVIASAASDEYSHRGPRDVAFDGDENTTPLRDGEYFVTEFFKAISYGKSVTEGFETATALTEIYTATGTGLTNAPYMDDSAQHPLYDDNEDGLGSNGLSFQAGFDGAEGQYLFIGASPPTGNDPGDVLITQVTESRFLLEIDDSVDLWARVDLPDRLKLIWAEVKQPGYAPGDPGAGYQIEMDTYRQATSLYGDGVYEWLNINGGTEYPGLFSFPGTYQVFYFAKDVYTGHVSPLKESKVYKARPEVWSTYTEANHAPGNFNLLVPVDAAIVQTSVALNWEDSSDEDGDPLTYTVLLSKNDATFADPIRKEGLGYSSCMLTAADGLEDLTTYYWKVLAVDQYGAVTESNEIWVFYTDNKNGPQISLVYTFVLDELGNMLSNAVVDPGSHETNASGLATLVLTSGIHTITANIPGGATESQTLECMGGEYNLQFVLPTVVPVMGDTDGDSDIDGADLSNLIMEFDVCTGNCNSDFDGDGDVDQDDLEDFSGAFGL